MILWTNLVKISILHGKIHFIFFHPFNPYLESIRSTSRASEYQRDSVFIATISGSVSIRTFLPQSLFGTVSVNVYIYNICLVSPLLLQPILANTLPPTTNPEQSSCSVYFLFILHLTRATGVPQGPPPGRPAPQPPGGCSLSERNETHYC